MICDSGKSAEPTVTVSEEPPEAASLSSARGSEPPPHAVRASRADTATPAKATGRQRGRGDEWWKVMGDLLSV